MSYVRERIVRFGAAAVVGATALWASWSGMENASGQIRPGEYFLVQGGTVGWVYVSPDKSSEWWAYIDGAYEWADQRSVGENRWELDAEYMGSPTYPGFGAWKAAVRMRPEAQGRTLIFQRHAVQEEVVQN